MSGLGGLNKTPDGVVIGLVQLQLPTIATKSDLATQTKKICAMVQLGRQFQETPAPGWPAAVLFDHVFVPGLCCCHRNEPSAEAKQLAAHIVTTLDIPMRI